MRPRPSPSSSGCATTRGRARPASSAGRRSRCAGMPEEESITIQFQAVLYQTTVPFRYLIELQVCGIRTGIAAYAWGKAKAQRVMQAFIDDGTELLDKYGKTNYVIQEVRAMRREEAMARVQVGDSVRLLV